MLYFRLGTKFKKKVLKLIFAYVFLVARPLPPSPPHLVAGPLKKDRYFISLRLPLTLDLLYTTKNVLQEKLSVREISLIH